VVCLEYDKSPVGPYLEYVTMGSLVEKRGALGQWGSRLFVSTLAAEEVCRRTWAVPAEVADIRFDEGPPGAAGEPARGAAGLVVAEAPSLLPKGGGQRRAGKESIRVGGWVATRSSGGEAAAAAAAGDSSIRRLFGGLPVLWTPSIKALWAPAVPFQPRASTGGGEPGPVALPLHRLRLSASSLRLHLCGQPATEALGVPLPFGLSVDGLRIEIAREDGEL